MFGVMQMFFSMFHDVLLDKRCGILTVLWSNMVSNANRANGEHLLSIFGSFTLHHSSKIHMSQEKHEYHNLSTRMSCDLKTTPNLSNCAPQQQERSQERSQGSKVRGFVMHQFQTSELKSNNFWSLG